jgi:hypothetical protein
MEGWCSVNSDLYYIQNRGYCGNCLRWWKDGGHGYTSNLDEAWKVSKERAEEICRSRPEEDIPWPASCHGDVIAEIIDGREPEMGDLFQ